MFSEIVLKYLEKDFSSYSPKSIRFKGENISGQISLTNWEETKTASIEIRSPPKLVKKLRGYSLIKTQELKETAKLFAKEILCKELKQDRKVHTFYRAEKQLENTKIKVNYFEPEDLGKYSVGERVYIDIEIDVKNKISKELKETIERLDSILTSVYHPFLLN